MKTFLKRDFYGLFFVGSITVIAGMLVLLIKGEHTYINDLGYCSTMASMILVAVSSFLRFTRSNKKLSD